MHRSQHVWRRLWMTGWAHGIRERRRRLLAGRKVAVKILKRTLWQGFVVSRTFCARVCAQARSNGHARARPHVRGAFLTVPMHVSIRKCIYMPIPTVCQAWAVGVREKKRRLLAGRKIALRILNRELSQGFEACP